MSDGLKIEAYNCSSITHFSSLFNAIDAESTISPINEIKLIFKSITHTPYYTNLNLEKIKPFHLVNMTACTTSSLLIGFCLLNV